MTVTPRLFRRAPLMLVVLAVTLLVMGCMSQSPSAARQSKPTPTMDMVGFCEDLSFGPEKDYCYQQVELATRNPWNFKDRRAVQNYLELDHEEATEWSVQEEREDRTAEAEYWATEEAEMWASVKEAELTTEADYRNDAVRDCIRAGHNETLCLLDPENPEGD